MKTKFLFGAVLGFVALLLIAATTTEVNIANLPLASGLSPTNSVLVLTNASKARLATVQQIFDAVASQVQPPSDNLTNWSALATSAKQPASDNLTNWSAIATSTKQPASANLTNWSAIATNSKQDTLTVTTPIIGTNGTFGATVQATNGYLKGSFTGITTTNTFYSVTADLMSTVTNVVTIQGGIVVSWVVTP